MIPVGGLLCKKTPWSGQPAGRNAVVCARNVERRESRVPRYRGGRGKRQNSISVAKAFCAGVGSRDAEAIDPPAITKRLSAHFRAANGNRSEEHTSELQSL